MIKVKVNEHVYNVALFVFDKDGLMFESRQFWIELAKTRAQLFHKYIDGATNEIIQEWLNLMGISSLKISANELLIQDVDHLGVLAVASVPEEIAVTAAFIIDKWKVKWTKARQIATTIFEEADKAIVLQRALIPRKGFPDILKRIRQTDIPYVIATSDTYERAEKSINMFDDFQYVSFVVTPLDVKKGKPNPDMLQYIAKKTKVPMENIMMIGDSYVDVLMAKSAGAIGIGIPEEEDMAKKMYPYALEIIKDLDAIEFLEKNI